MLREIAVLALTFGTVNLASVAPARAQTGFLCGFASITDPTVEGDVQTGEIDGGPLLAADTDRPGEETADMYLICTIQVGAQGATHAGADAASATAWGPAVVTLLPTLVNYVAPAGQPVYLCTEVWIDSGFGHETVFFDETGDDATRGWSSSSGAACALAVSQEISVSECSDGVDNDLDGQTDFPNDPQCTSPDDNSELT